MKRGKPSSDERLLQLYSMLSGRQASDVDMSKFDLVEYENEVGTKKYFFIRKVGTGSQSQSVEIPRGPANDHYKVGEHPSLVPFNPDDHPTLQEAYDETN